MWRILGRNYEGLRCAQASDNVIDVRVAILRLNGEARVSLHVHAVP